MRRNLLHRFEILEDRALLSADFSRAALFASSLAAPASQPSAEIAPAPEAAIAQVIASPSASTPSVSPQAADAAFAQQPSSTTVVTAQPSNQTTPMAASSGSSGGWVNPDYFRERFGKEAGPEPSPGTGE